MRMEYMWHETLRKWGRFKESEIAEVLNGLCIMVGLVGIFVFMAALMLQPELTTPVGTIFAGVWAMVVLLSE